MGNQSFAVGDDGGDHCCADSGAADAEGGDGLAVGLHHQPLNCLKSDGSGWS